MSSIALPITNKWRTTTIDRYGSSVILQCPFKVGALSQQYQITWKLDGKNESFPRNHNTRISDDHYPLLTLSDIQEENIGVYSCDVNVTNPYDGTSWHRIGTHILSKLLSISHGRKLLLPFFYRLYFEIFLVYIFFCPDTYNLSPGVSSCNCIFMCSLHMFL